MSSQVERLARAGLIMEGENGENGELLSLRDHEEGGHLGGGRGGGGEWRGGGEDGGIGVGGVEGGEESQPFVVQTSGGQAADSGAHGYSDSHQDNNGVQQKEEKRKSRSSNILGE